ncbi:MAG: hypothetical protein ACXVPX_02825 [Actinomycetota bacterium]
MAVLLTAGAAFAFVRASEARTAAVADAGSHARVIAATKLAPLLEESDLTSPITGARYDQVEAAVKRSILDRTRVKQITIWSDIGRVLFAQDQAAIGTRPTFIRDFVYSVANGTTQTQVESGTVKTFTPIWRQPGGTVAVAELDQPFGPVAGTVGRLQTLAALVLGLGSLVCWVLFAMTWRPGGAKASARPSLTGEPNLRRAASASGAQALGPVMAAAPPSVVKRVTEASAGRPPGLPDPGLRDAEKARTEAEQRARAAEERLSRLQLQHKQAMERLQALEARLSVAAAAPKHSQEELRALRDQVRDSAERLHTAETENEQLRARLGTPHLPGVVSAGGSQR